MPDDAQLSEKEMSKQIVAGMALVHALFNESITLFKLFVQKLDASDADLRSFGGKAFILPKDRKGSVAADRFLKTDLGLFAEIGGIGTEEQEDLGDEDDDIEENESENDKATIPITPDSQFLGVRAILFDPKVPNPEDFTPCIVAVVFTNLVQTPSRKKKQGQQPQTSFQLRRAFIKRLVKMSTPSIAESNHVACKIRGGELSATVASVLIKPLASFNSESAVEGFVEKIVDMIENG